MSEAVCTLPAFSFSAENVSRGVCACACACVHACVRACVRVCMCVVCEREREIECVCVCVCVHVPVAYHGTVLLQCGMRGFTCQLPLFPHTSSSKALVDARTASKAITAHHCTL
jgi:hypothetical protein